MRLDCPSCGARDVGEFRCHGALPPRRPDPQAADCLMQFVAYAYLRANPAGRLEELWYHEFGCRSWLVVTRDTLTHAVEAVREARDIDA